MKFLPINYRILNYILPQEVHLKVLPKISGNNIQKIFIEYLKAAGTANKYIIDKQDFLDSLKGKSFSLLTTESCCTINFLIKTDKIYFVVTLSKKEYKCKEKLESFLLFETISSSEKGALHDCKNEAILVQYKK